MTLNQMCHFGSRQRQDFARALRDRVYNGRSLENGPLYSSTINRVLHARVAFPICPDPWAHVGRHD